MFDFNIDWAILAVFGFPLTVVALSLAYAAYHHYLNHRERMAMIERGMIPEDLENEKGLKNFSENSSSPIVITLVGIAITLGLLTIGIGPWLIGGLVPTAYGCAMLIKQIRDEKQRPEAAPDNLRDE